MRNATTIIMTRSHKKISTSLMAFFETATKSISEAPLPGNGAFIGNIQESFAGNGISSQRVQDRRHLAFWEDGVRDAFANPGKRPNWDVSYDSYSKSVDHGRRILLKKPSERTAREQDALVDYFVKVFVRRGWERKVRCPEAEGTWRKAQEAGRKVSAAQHRYDPCGKGQHLPTHVRISGNWTEKGDAVTPATPGRYHL